MSSLRAAVDAIYATLGLAPPVSPPGQEFGFELSGVPVVLRVDAGGRIGTVHANLGVLSASAHEAGAQLGQLLRLGLGLTALNRAALEVPGASALASGQETDQRQVYAVAIFPLDEPDEAVESLRAVMEWRGYAETVIAPPTPEGGEKGTMSDGRGLASSAGAQRPDEDYVIFQP